MLLTEDNDMIQAISADKADEPFGVSIVKSSQLHLYCVIGHKPSWLRMRFIPCTGASSRS